MRTAYIEATVGGTAGASYQTLPPTDRPYKLNGVSRSGSGKTLTHVHIALSRSEAQQVIDHWRDFVPGALS